MNYNILVTGAGTASAVSIIRVLKKQKQFSVTIFAADIDALAPGLHLADHQLITPILKDPGYFSILENQIKRNHINILIPTFSSEVEFFAEKANDLKKLGVRLLNHNIEAIQICQDKYRFYQYLKERQIDTPFSFLPDEISKSTKYKFPLVTKPVTGTSSRNTHKIIDTSELAYFIKKYPRHLLQQYIEGPEFTVDVLSNKEHLPIVISPRIRISTKAGQTVKGEMVNPVPFTDVIHQLCNELKLCGVCNFQFISHGNRMYLLEINPRFAAGGMMLTVAAGANIPLLYLKVMLDQAIKLEECQVNEGVKMTRYWQELII